MAGDTFSYGAHNRSPWSKSRSRKKKSPRDRLWVSTSPIVDALRQSTTRWSGPHPPSLRLRRHTSAAASAAACAATCAAPAAGSSSSST
eukprot:172411-Prymnesium_polylepis.1